MSLRSALGVWWHAMKLTNESPEDCEAAASAIGALGDQRGIRPLVEFLENWGARHLVNGAIILTRLPPARRQALDDSMGNDIAQNLRSSLNKAVQTGNMSSLVGAEKSLMQDVTDRKQRLVPACVAAVAALGELHAIQAVDILEIYARGDVAELRSAAQNALRSIRGPGQTSQQGVSRP